MVVPQFVHGYAIQTLHGVYISGGSRILERVVSLLYGAKRARKFCGHAHFRPPTSRVRPSQCTLASYCALLLSKLEAFHELLFCLAVYNGHS